MPEETVISSAADTLRALADRHEILELSARYNRAADGTDVATLLEVFSEDAVVEMHGGPNGPAVFAGEALTGLVAPFEGQRVHLTTDAIVAVDGDRATQQSTLLLCTRSKKRGVAALFTGRYDDELVRTSDGWRFSRRLVHVDYANEGRMPLADAAEVK
jgi:ketosteroid isomerase-like protein